MIDAPFGPRKPEYNQELAKLATWMLRGVHIDVVTPTQVLQDFPANTYSLDEKTIKKLRRLFLNELSTVQEDQSHRAATRKLPTSQISGGNGPCDEGMSEIAMYAPLVSHSASREDCADQKQGVRLQCRVLSCGHGTTQTLAML